MHGSGPAAPGTGVDTGAATRGRRERARLPRLSPTLLILVPVCSLLFLGAPYLLRGIQFDDRLFLSAAHGVLTHGYPFETFHTPAGQPFYDHTPLFVYLMTGPALLDDLIGMRAAVVSGRLICAAFGVATVVTVYLVCRDVRGPVSGVLAAVLVAANPLFERLAWAMRMELPMAFFLVLALYLLVHERWLWAGLAIAVAVMLKEHALGFWIVASAYGLLLHRWRPALQLALPSVLAFAAWALVARGIDPRQFQFVLNRWLSSVGGENPGNRRFALSWGAWTLVVARDAIGPMLGGMSVLAVAVALARRAPVPVIAAVPIAYSLLAVIASYLVHLKEERWLVAVIPMAAIAVGLLVDWGAVARWVTRHGATRTGKSQVSPA